MAIQQDKQLFTPQEVADMLQLNVLTVYSYIRNKVLMAVRMGRNYRITKKDLDTFIETHKTY